MQRVKVFISSTFKDLENFRIEIDKVVRMLEGDSIYMEHHLSNHRNALENCLKEVDECDIFVGIYAFRYGYIPIEKTLSITELEYDRAVKTGKNLILYLAEESIKTNVEYKSEFTTTNDDDLKKLSDLKTRISTRHTAKPFSNKQELGKLLAIEVAKYYFLKIRGQSPNNPLSNYPLPDKIQYPNFDESPYVGLRYFEEQDARVFWGRNQLVYDLIQSLEDTGSIILFYGSTGVGKSSILHAGFIPRISGLEWLSFSFRRSKTKGLDVQTYEVLDQISKETLKSVLIIDQVEEIWTNPKSDNLLESINFFQKLREFEDENVKIILSFREEFLAKIQNEFKEIRSDENQIIRKRISYNEIRINPMSHGEIIDAVVQVQADSEAKKRYRIIIDEDLPHEIAFDLKRDNHSHIAPLLQITLKKMWVEARLENPIKDDKVLFDTDLYKKVKNDGLMGFLNEQIQSTAKYYKEEVENGLVLDLLHFFITEQITANQHSFAAIKERYPHIDKIEYLIQELENKYLLLKSGKQSQYYRLSHDALAPLIQAIFQNSFLPGQKATRILNSKDLSQITDEHFTEAELEVLESGRSGMRIWKEEEKKSIETTKGTFAKRLARNKAQQQLIRRGIALIVLVCIILSFVAYNLQKQKNEYYALNLANESENIPAPQGLQMLSYAANQTNDSMAINFIYNKLTDKFNYGFLQVLHEVNRANYNDDIYFSTNSKWLINKKVRPYDGYIGYSTHDLLDSETGIENSRLKNESLFDNLNISKDGRYIVLGDDYIFDLIANDRVNYFPKEPKYETRISPKSQFLYYKNNNTYEWRIWHLPTQKLITTFDRSIENIVFSENSQFFVTIGRDSLCRLWDFTHINKNTFVDIPNHKGTNVKFSTDNSWLLLEPTSTDFNKNWKIWDIKRKEYADISLEKDISDINFTSNGEWLIIEKNQKYQLRNVKTGKAQTVLNSSAYYDQLIVSSDCKWILLKDQNGKVVIKGMQNGLSPDFLNQTTITNFTSFSYDGQYLIFENPNKEFEVWNLRYGKKLDFINPELKIKGIEISNDNKYLLTKHPKNEYRIWKIVNQTLKPFYVDNQEIGNYEFSQNGQLLLVKTSSGKYKFTNPIANTSKFPDRYSQDYYELKYSPGQTYLINQLKYREYRIFNSQTEKEIFHLIDKDFTFSSNDKMLLISDPDNNKHKLLNPETGKEFDLLKNLEKIENVVFSNDGNLALFKDSTQKSRLYNAKNNQLSDFIIDGNYSIKWLADNNTKVILSGGTNEYCAYDLKQKKIVSKKIKIESHTGYSKITISSSGQWIVASDPYVNQMSERAAQGVKSEVFNTVTGKSQYIIKDNLVWNVYISPDSKYLLCDNKKGTQYKIFDIETGNPVKFLSHLRTIDNAYFSADKIYLTTVTNHKLIVWDLATLKPITNIWLDLKPSSVKYLKNDLLIVAFGKQLVKLNLKTQRGNFFSYGNGLTLSYSRDEVIEWTNTFKNQYLNPLSDSIKVKYHIKD